MRLTYRHLAAAVVAALTSLTLSGCQGSDLPMPPNGPSGQSFSTNNALIRVVNGSPTAGIASAGCPSTCIDVVVDGSVIALKDDEERADFEGFRQGEKTGAPPTFGTFGDLLKARKPK